MARKAAHHAWETFKERFRAAFRQATAAWIGDMAIAAQAAIAPTS